MLLEKAFRRRTKACGRCVFSLPFAVPARRSGQSNWSVEPAEGCTQNCRMVLEELVAEFQAAYRLSDSGRFHALDWRGAD